MMQDDAGLVEVIARAQCEKNRLNCAAWVMAQGKDPGTVKIPQLLRWNEMPKEGKDVALDLARAALAAIEAAGFKVVPVEPTANATKPRLGSGPWENVSAAPKQG